MNRELYAEMYEMEQRHWWFAAKHRIVAGLLRRMLRPSSGGKARVADLGCGCGMMLHVLEHDYDVIGVDSSDQAIEFARQRGVRVVAGSFPEQIPLEKGAFDAVLMLDVLEHLDDDAAAVNSAAALLRPGGIIIATVPAYQWLWSKRDEHHHHRRRYAKARFRCLFGGPGLKLEMLSYLNTFLFPLAAAARLASKVFGSGAATTDLRVPPVPVNAILRQIFACEGPLLGRLPMPFGLSLAAAARRI